MKIEKTDITLFIKLWNNGGFTLFLRDFSKMLVSQSKILVAECHDPFALILQGKIERQFKPYFSSLDDSVLTVVSTLYSSLKSSEFPVDKVQGILLTYIDTIKWNDELEKYSVLKHLVDDVLLEVAGLSGKVRDNEQTEEVFVNNNLKVTDILIKVPEEVVKRLMGMVVYMVDDAYVQSLK